MRTQQQADREEQQRIKNLVLNYEASNENETAESKIDPSFFQNPGRKKRKAKARTRPNKQSSRF
jgi:hypothetical protein